MTASPTRPDSGPDLRQRIDIALPLPAHIVATLSNLLDAAYPGAVIDTTAPYGTLRVVLPDQAQPVQVSPDRAHALTAQPPDNPDDQVDLLAWQHDDDGAILSLNPPERLARIMTSLAAASLDQHNAVNYVEQIVHETSAPYRRFVITASRSEEQTPHALRIQAETERDAALDEVARLTTLLDQP